MLTPVEYLEARYGNSVRGLIAVSGILIKFIDLGIKLFAISIVVHVVTGWEVVPVIVVSGLITIAYVFIGGLWATVLTDLVQFVVQLIMSLAVLFIALDMVGGWKAMWDSLPQERAGFLQRGRGDQRELLAGLCGCDHPQLQRGHLGTGTAIRVSGKAAGCPEGGEPVGDSLLVLSHRHFRPRWAAPLLMPEHFDPVTLQPIDGFDLDQTYILVTQKILSTLAPGLIGLLVCSMFAATMSMIDSDINALAAVFTKDFYQRNFKREIDDKALFKAGMITTAIFGIAVLATAIVISQSQGMNKVFSLTVNLFGGLLSPIAIPLMLGMIWKRPTARGAILSFIGGVITYFIMIQYTDRFEIYTGVEILVALAIYFGEGYIGKRSEEKEAEVTALFDKIRT